MILALLDYYYKQDKDIKLAINKTINELEGSYAIGVIWDDDFYDKKIVILNVHNIVMPIISVISLQLIAYEVANLGGCDIDKPRNLAKSVTVE